MKRLFIFSLLLLSSAAYAKNKISMVTYFPVPYVAYSQVNTTDQMDIGLTSTCDMKLGCSEPSATLNATRVNLKGGKLNLDGGRGIKGYTLSLGSGNGDGKISFQNVRIQTGNMESVNAQDMKVSALELFGKTFPSCKEKDSSGQMKWASLKLKGASSNELYLACGDLGESTGCSNTPSKLTESRTCPTGTGTQTRTWNATTCSWGAWLGECVEENYVWKRYGEECWVMLSSVGSLSYDNRGSAWECTCADSSALDSALNSYSAPYGVDNDCKSWAAKLGENGWRTVKTGTTNPVEAKVSCSRSEQNMIYLHHVIYGGSVYGHNLATGCFSWRCEKE